MVRVLCLALLLGSSLFGQLRLVDGGKSSYSIVIAADASPAEHRAASEFQRFVAEMSGARLPILTDAESPHGPLVLIGNSRALASLRAEIPFDTLGAEGFVVKAAGSSLIIAGGRPRGTLYAVYTLLDQLGCRWFTSEVSRIPRLRTITIAPLPGVSKPAFEYREPYFTEALDKDWAARNRTNGNFQHLDESTGGKLQYCPFVHSFYEMIPPEKYFAAHPEYFSLIDGKRRTDRAQLCLTNPDMLREAVRNVFAWIREHPEATIYSVSQNDWEGWCECDRCRRVEEEEGGQHSGPLLRFVNAVAAEVEKQYPDKLIDTLAYWYTENPPLHVRPRPNVRIRLCPIGVCEAHSYEKCPRSAYFMRNLEAWSRITSQLYIWHYNTNFSHYLIPFPDFDELAANLPTYRRHGVVGVFLEGAYAAGGGGENAELRSYIMARLLWDPQTDVNRAVQEFLEGVYGRAAKPLRAYYDLLQQQARQGMHIWINPVPDYSAAFSRRAHELFREAEAAAENEAVRRRVRKARLSIDYLDLLRAREFTVRGDAYAPADLPSLETRFRAFLASVRGFGITSLHEGRDLHFDEEDFAARMKPYRVVTLENDAWRVDVAPELSGRVIRMIDRRQNRDLLRRVDPGEREYPDQGGLGIFAYPDYHGRPWKIEWSLEAAPGGGALTLRGRLPNGLTLHRQIALHSGTLHTTTTLKNEGTEPVEAALQARVEWNPGNIDQALVSFQRRDGTPARVQLIRVDQPPTGSETYLDARQPAGEWRVGTLLNRFPQAQVERTWLNWTAKGDPRVVFGLWSPIRKLAPGETLDLEADYGQ